MKKRKEKGGLMSKKIGLVLAGGGGKGSYHIGVWKALREYGVDLNITGVSGTSIGGLNAALFIQGDYEIAESVWLSLSQDQVLTINPEKLARKLTEAGLVKISKWILGLKNYGWFTRDGLLKVINENIDLEMISNSDIISFVTCCETPSLIANYFKLNGCSADKITNIMLATSSLPIIYDSVEIEDKFYIDGGIPTPKADNVPIKPIYNAGFDIIIVVHLNRTHIIDNCKYPNAQILEIFPQEDLGGFKTGVLDFTPESTRGRMKQGYKDAKKILEPIYEMGILQGRINQTMKQMVEDERMFKEKKSIIMNERKSKKDELEELLRG